ncbi:MAG: hypothetical protein SNJ64_03340 [Endomicrobiia bacterium]
MEKILFFTSQKNEYPVLQIVFNKYQTQTITLPKKDFDSVIINFQPQTIIFDEHIPLKIIKKIVRKYPFVPFNVIGELTDPVKLEKLLALGVNLIKLPITEKELETIFSNIMWFSLSKPDLWQQEVELSVLERRDKILYYGIKILVIIIIIVGTFFLANKTYNSVINKQSVQKIYFETVLPYVTPSDITFLDKSYLISDWNIRNIFQHDIETDKMMGMFVPEYKFNSIASYVSGKERYIFTSSIFVDKIYVYKYPDFEFPEKEIVPIQNNTIISMHIDGNKLFILDNKKNLYEFMIQDDFNILLLSSSTITEFLPVDIFVYDSHMYVLDDKNILYKFIYPELEKVSVIDLNTFFAQENQIISFAINDKWLYLLNERDKKSYKISNKVLM